MSDVNCLFGSRFFLRDVYSFSNGGHPCLKGLNPFISDPRSNSNHGLYTLLRSIPFLMNFNLDQERPFTCKYFGAFDYSFVEDGTRLRRVSDVHDGGLGRRTSRRDT